MRGKAWRGSDVSFGDYGLKAMEPCWLTDRQIEAARVAMTRFIKRGGKIWVRVFPDKPITKKPQETRMGKGKGAPEQWVCVVRPGRIMFEMEGVTETQARRAMQLAAAKLPSRPGSRCASPRSRRDEQEDGRMCELSVEDLRTREHDLDDQLFRLRIQKSMGQLERRSRCAWSARPRAGEDAAEGEAGLTMPRRGAGLQPADARRTRA